LRIGGARCLGCDVIMYYVVEKSVTILFVFLYVFVCLLAKLTVLIFWMAVYMAGCLWLCVRRGVGRARLQLQLQLSLQLTAVLFTRFDARRGFLNESQSTRNRSIKVYF
jgi:hypothetical protein